MNPIPNISTWVVKTRKVDDRSRPFVTRGKPYKIQSWSTAELETFFILNDEGNRRECATRYWECCSFEENLKQILE